MTGPLYFFMRFPVMVLSIAGSGRENTGQKLVAITIVLKKTAAHNPACNAGLWDLLRVMGAMADEYGNKSERTDF